MIANTVPVALQNFFAQHPVVSLAFSGGVDSAYLLYAAKACGCRVKAYYVKSQFQPAFELADAQRFAAQLSAELELLSLDALADETVRENPTDRCYFCKKNIFGLILAAATRDGFALLMDGTNASDRADDRPGMRALAELRVVSPLRECGITKAALREYSRAAGLFTWDKPAYACLATRVPTGVAITASTLERVEVGEGLLMAMGFTDLRLRITPAGAKLQLPENQLDKLLKMRNTVVNELSPYFDEITLDLKGAR